MFVSCRIARATNTTHMVLEGAQSVFVIGLDPGARVSYFAMRVDMVVTLGSSMHTPIFSVLSFGSIAVDFSKENAALDALTNPLDPVWEAAEL